MPIALAPRYQGINRPLATSGNPEPTPAMRAFLALRQLGTIVLIIAIETNNGDHNQ